MGINNNNYDRVPGAAGGAGKQVVPTISVDTLRGGRKGDPQHSCCGKSMHSGRDRGYYQRQTDIPNIR